MGEHRPTTEDCEALELLLANERLTDWEAGFCESLAEWPHWTEKQVQKFNEIWSRLYG